MKYKVKYNACEMGMSKPYTIEDIIDADSISVVGGYVLFTKDDTTVAIYGENALVGVVQTDDPPRIMGRLRI